MIFIVYILSLLIVQSVVAFIPSCSFRKGNAQDQYLATNSLLMSTMDKVSASASESLKRQLIDFKKVIPRIITEEKRMALLDVPTLQEVEKNAKISERSIASKTFCSRSGGYPDLDVKDGIYLLLWASMTHNLNQAQAAPQEMIMDDEDDGKVMI
jgi:hypothetical protein